MKSPIVPIAVFREEGNPRLKLKDRPSLPKFIAEIPHPPDELAARVQLARNQMGTGVLDGI